MEREEKRTGPGIGAGSRTERQTRITTKRKRKAGTVSSTEGWRKRKRHQEPCREWGGTVREQQRGTEREEMNRKDRDSGIQNEKPQ